MIVRLPVKVCGDFSSAAGAACCAPARPGSYSAAAMDRVKALLFMESPFGERSGQLFGHFCERASAFFRARGGIDKHRRHQRDLHAANAAEQLFGEGGGADTRRNAGARARVVFPQRRLHLEVARVVLRERGESQLRVHEAGDNARAVRRDIDAVVAAHCAYLAASSARFSFSTLTTGSPRMPSSRPSVCFATSSRTRCSGRLLAFAIRATW